MKTLSNLDVARFKYNIASGLHSLRSNSYISDNEVAELPQTIPSRRAEIQTFLQELYHHGLRKHLPGCPVRVNNHVLSVRLDGNQYRRAQEIRKLFEKNGIREFLSQKASSLYRQIEQNNGSFMRNNGGIEYKEEEGRQFFHVPYTSRASIDENSFSNIYSLIARQGRSDDRLSRIYDQVMALVAERNESRRREFIRNRTQLNTDYIKAIIEAITIPLEALQGLPNGQALISAAQEAGLDAFYKQPDLKELAKTNFVVDVYSSPTEDDESWYITPVTPVIVESTPELTYHGQGVITSYDADPQRSKNGALPFVVQHCLRTGANLEDFLEVLPVELLEKINKSNGIYAQVVGGTSEGLDAEGLRRGMQRVDGQQGMSRSDLDRMIQDVFGTVKPEEQAVEEVKTQAAQSLTENFLKQLEAVKTEQEEEQDDIPFEPEPSAPSPTQDELAERLRRQLQEQQEARARRGYHEAYGTNPIFGRFNGDAIVSYLAFRGNEAREFANYNQACIYAGKPVGHYQVFDVAQRLEEPTEATRNIRLQFNGSLF